MSQSKTPTMIPASEEGESAYARYLLLPSPADTVRGWFFSGLVSFVKAQGGEPALEQCQQLLGAPGVQLSFVSYSNYPVMDFLRVAHAASRALAARFGGHEALARQLGMATVRDFLNSTVGKTRLALAGSSPKKLLSTFPAAYREAVSFGERTVTMRGDRAAYISVKRDLLPPAHTEGILLALLEASSAGNCQVRSRWVGSLQSEYEVSWE
jgi:uncharacterized protein (TIGR02265 family)